MTREKMPRVYISFLGTSNYSETVYCWGDRQKKVRFVQEATLDFFCHHWTDQDRIWIFTTKEAYHANWLDNGHTDKITGNPLPCRGLESCIQSLGLKPHQQDIPTGKDEKEIWEIFDTVFSKFNPNDRVIFDITHGFRSIPTLAVIILNYAKVMKNITIEGIYYGALEAKQDGNVPIFDLTPFDTLMNWGFAIDRFINSMDARQACELAKNAVNPILKNTQGQDHAAKTIRYITQQLEKMSKALSTCRGPEISGIIQSLKNIIHDAKHIDILPPFYPLLERIQKQLSAFSGNNILDGIQAAKWCLDHNLIQQSYTILQETLVSYFVSQIDENPLDDRIRTLSTKAVYVYRHKPGDDELRKMSIENMDILNKFIRLYQDHDELIELFTQITPFRNDLNHGGYRNNFHKADDFGKKLRELMPKIENNLLTAK